MKIRESGMPPEDYWSSFYDARCVVSKLISRRNCTVVEFGFGYGTFTIPAAKRVSGPVYAFDIEKELGDMVSQKAKEAGCRNVHACVRDFVECGTGLHDSSVDHAMLYNILHVEDPNILLREAYRILKPGASVSAIHWRSDRDTPRGPSLDIRPKPEQCARWMERAGFIEVAHVDLPCCPYHYALTGVRPFSH
jgi:ubiquinone/menaquinone biosynthesis C-methylase UbiE